MLLLLLTACIENTFVPPEDEKPFDDTEDTASPVDSDTDADTGEDTDTDLPTDTDTGVPVDTDTDPVVDTGPGPDTDVDTGPDTDVDTGPDDTDTWTYGVPVVEGVCASTYTSWSDTAATEPELHVIGMYESQGGYPGPAYVYVERGTEMILALTSYAAVDWQVELDAGSDVTEILVSSYDVSSVTFLTSVTAPVVYGGWVGECGYEYPDMDPTSGCETPDLEAVLEAGTGLAMASFQGCYSGGTFRLE